MKWRICVKVRDVCVKMGDFLRGGPVGKWKLGLYPLWYLGFQK